MKTNDKKLYIQPEMKVCIIESSDIIATSDPNPDEIYPNLRD